MKWFPFSRSHCGSTASVAAMSLLSVTQAFSGFGRARIRSVSSLKSFSKRIADAYDSQETDGILQLARAESIRDIPPDELVDLTLEAVGIDNRGQFAGIMNAWIASCIPSDEEASDSASSLYAIDLLRAYDDIYDFTMITPDMVTLCLLYTALDKSDMLQEQAAVLERARRTVKKLAGSRRRKSLVALRRRGPARSGESSILEIQNLLGQDFGVLHETSDLLVINKPSGYTCYHNRDTSAGKVRKGYAQDASLTDALLHCAIPLSSLNPDAMGIVHRLDRGTSGCMVLAKTDEAHARLVSEFFLRNTQKEYTVLSSPPPSLDEYTIDSPVNERPARSEYKVIERFGDKAALGSMKIFTGRKHQVRVHCADVLSSPIIGDEMYGDASTNAMFAPDESQTDLNRLHLHASSLCIPSMNVDVHAPLPSFWSTTIEQIKADT